jgi:MarR family transcriptional regulator, 2-MHQ and catechol-resistance regulon repressor
LVHGLEAAIAPGFSAWLEDPLAHRALDALLRAESSLTRRLAHELERRGLSATGFGMLVVVASAGGRLALRTLRLRLGISKANASEVTATLADRGLITRERNELDRRAVTVAITPAGQRLVEELFPDHARRVRDAFLPLDDEEKRALARLCRKLDRAA